MHVLVTGAAGFIGFHLSRALLDAGHTVVGLDNLTPYYDVQLKRDRLQQLTESPSFSFCEADISDAAAVRRVFSENAFTHVVNLAAQAGVRYSITHPESYIQTNLVGFSNILEGCRHAEVQHLVYASSSSVYGLNTRMPFSEQENVDHPVSLYAATKKSNELMAHSYSHLFRLPTTGLRFFTVYGPWGRPDMALFLFTRAILEGRPIDVFNHGKMLRDFTYIGDIVRGVLDVLVQPPSPDSGWNSDTPNPATSTAPYALYNIGNNNPVPLDSFIEAIEKALGMKAQKNLLPMQPGDVPATSADISRLHALSGFEPATPLEEGIQAFIDWYRSYYRV